MSKVYVAAADEEGPCKIGVSIDPAARISSLQTGNPARLSIVHSVETVGTPLTESRVHEYLKDARILGEWFDVNTTQAQNAVTAMENWGDQLSKAPPDFVRKLAHDVELFCPPKVTVEQVIHIAALILGEPEWRASLRDYMWEIALQKQKAK